MCMHPCTPLAQNNPQPPWPTLLCVCGTHNPSAQTTEDAETRDEKIRRASCEIKTANANSPANSKQLPPTLHEVNGHAVRTSLEQQQQQHQSDAAQSAGVCQDGSEEAAADPQQLVLTPQEVLQELLGDMYIHTTRLTMGALHCVA